MKAAIAQLEIYRDTLRHNEPINRAEGAVEQADAEAQNLLEVEAALLALSRYDTMSAALLEMAKANAAFYKLAHDAMNLPTTDA